MPAVWNAHHTTFLPRNLLTMWSLVFVVIAPLVSFMVVPAMAGMAHLIHDQQGWQIKDDVKF
jgi:hypothetical protein